MATKRKTAEYNPTYRLTVEDRRILGIMGLLDLWPKAHLAALFGVSRKTVHMCIERIEDEVQSVVSS